jgi:muconolactone D-isomerase
VGLQPYPVVPVGSARCTQWEDEPRAVITEVAQQVVQKRLNPVERKEKPMEYLTDLVTTVPEGTSPVKVDELRAAEAVRAAELAKAGHLVRLWRPPLGPDEWRSIGLFRASLPLHIWMKVTITPLSPHPNDPEYRSRQAMDHPQV